jgi:uncharacterized protein (TIGR02145 family)
MKFILSYTAVLLLLLTSSVKTMAQNQFKDSRDGNEYETISIGDQIWMADNLKFLPKVSSPTKNSEVKPLYYVYNYSGKKTSEAIASSEYKNQGVLYNYAAALNACPDGYHLPSNAEWEMLASYVVDDKGGKQNGYELTGSGDDWTKVGNNLKSKTGWSKVAGTDDYNFKAVPSPYYNSNRKQFDPFKDGSWLTSTETNMYEANHVFYRNVANDNEKLTCGTTNKSTARAVRCIKD